MQRASSRTSGFSTKDFLAGRPGTGSLLDTDVVIWYTLGVTHLVRPEDEPVMPAFRVGFRLLPTGFFSRNPAINGPGAGSR